MPSPLRAKAHGKPHNQLGTWLGTYESETPGVGCFDNSTVRLDLDNEPQPDLVLIKLAEKGGQTHFSPDDYIEGAPELAVEIVGSSRAYDLHQKKGAYRRNGVREYLAWITREQSVVWWQLNEGEYRESVADPDGLPTEIRTSHTYDAAGHLVRSEARSFVAGEPSVLGTTVTIFTYDAEGRLRSAQRDEDGWQGSDAVGPPTRQITSYDAMGNPLRVENTSDGQRGGTGTLYTYSDTCWPRP